MPFEAFRQHLLDILDSIRLIDSFVNGMSYQQYAADPKTRAAVERHLQIITEAVYSLGDNTAAVSAQQDWAAYRGMGNLLRHAYHRVQDEIVWDTIFLDLPSLQADVEAALRRPDSTDPLN